MNDIIKFIDEEIDKLKIPDMEELELIEKCNKIDFNNSNDLKNISPEEMLVILRYAYDEEKDIKKIKKECNEILKGINFQDDIYETSKILELLIDASEEQLKDLKAFYEKDKMLKGKTKFKELTEYTEKMSKSSLFIIMELIKYSHFDENKLKNNYKLIALLDDIDEKILDSWTSYLYLYNWSKEEPNEFLGNSNKRYIKTTDYLSLFYSELNREYKNSKRTYNKLLTSYSSLKEKLLNIKEGNYIALPNEYYNKLPIEFLIELSYRINEYNTNICNNLSLNNEKIEGFEINNILLKYEIKNRLKKAEIEFVLSNCDIDELELSIMSIAGIMKKTNFNNQILLNILTYSNKEKIDNVKKGLLLKLINIDFIKNNPSIFLSPANEILATNIELLKNNACKGNNFNELLLDKNLEKYFELAKGYGLNVQDSNIIKNMTKPYFFDAIDVFIEKGVYEVLLNNPILFNYDLVKIIKRIMIAEKMQINIFDETNLLSKQIIDGTNFCVPDDLLDQYMFNIVPLSISKENVRVLNSDKRLEYVEDEKLDEQFKTSDLTYTFNGVNISRMKVLRNRVVSNNENDLIDCIIYGSILNQQEYNVICDEVNAKKLKKEI